MDKNVIVKKTTDKEKEEKEKEVKKRHYKIEGFNYVVIDTGYTSRIGK